MISQLDELDRITLLVWSRLVPLADVLTHADHYERLTRRLIVANGDAMDILTAQTSSPDRAIILKAAALVRGLLTDQSPPEE